jgi:hypothetical protein
MDDSPCRKGEKLCLLTYLSVTKHFPERGGKREGSAMVDFMSLANARNAFQETNGKECVSSPRSTRTDPELLIFDLRGG